MALPLLLATALSATAPRIALGQYDRWGAFREGRPPVCFAIAEPGSRRSAPDRPFLAVASWPGRGIAAQLHVHLGGPMAGDSITGDRITGDRMAAQRTVTLRIDGAVFPLLAGQADAWAHDMREDVRIVAAMRRADRLTVEVRGPGGRHHADRYALAGAASAIDAAAVGCLQR